MPSFTIFFLVIHQHWHKRRWQGASSHAATQRHPGSIWAVAVGTNRPIQATGTYGFTKFITFAKRSLQNCWITFASPSSTRQVGVVSKSQKYCDYLKHIYFFPTRLEAALRSGLCSWIQKVIMPYIIAPIKLYQKVIYLSVWGRNMLAEAAQDDPQRLHLP